MAYHSESDELLTALVARAGAVMSALDAVVLYGAAARTERELTSDIDVLFVGEGPAGTVDFLTEIVLTESARRGLPLDEEVPYANKLLVDLRELARAAEAGVFRNGLTAVPVEPGYLTGPGMRERLLVNILCTRTHDWTRTPGILDAARLTARRAMVRRAVADLERAGAPASDDAVLALLVGPSAERYKEWLGFAGDPASLAHLRSSVLVHR